MNVKRTLKSRAREALDGLATTRWPLIILAATAVVLYYVRGTALDVLTDFAILAPGVVAAAFLTSKVLWDSYARRAGFRLPEDRVWSLCLFGITLLAFALVVG